MKIAQAGVIVCIHEDRLGQFPGVQFAIASLQRHSPELKIGVSFPNSSLEADQWIASRSGLVRLHLDRVEGNGWNIKPDLIRMLLEQGYAQVIWLDADIIVNGPILTKVALEDENLLVATQEPYWGQQQGNDFRTRAWSLIPARTLNATVNTGVVRVTQNHLELIKDWQILLNHPAYLEMQKIPDMQRPLHMLGDQEVLTALLGGKKYARTPVRLLQRGREIAQCFGAGGFAVTERIGNVFSLRSPQLIHAMGKKPWTRSAAPPGLVGGAGNLMSRVGAYYNYLMLETSPYLLVAKRLENKELSDSVWLNVHSFGGKLLSFVGFGNVNLIGMPLAVIDSAGKLIKRLFKFSRFSLDEKYFLKEDPLVQTEIRSGVDTKSKI